MKPFIMYMVGISGSGKTTIAVKLTERLTEKGLENIQFIDGDVIRQEMDGIFGYTYEERMRNNKAVCVVCSYLVRNKISVILAQVGGYRAMRDQVRGSVPADYIEVYVKCSFEECERRDSKGYYRKFRDGEMTDLNGADASFEVPGNSNIVLDTEQMTVDECVDAVMRYLETKGYI